VFEKLTASNPDAVYEVHKVLTDITGQEPAGQPKAKRDYREAAAQFDIVRRSGAPVDPVVCDYAKNGKFEETVAALSALCGAPTKLVESVMNDARPESDFALILAKAAGLSWPTVKHICILRRKAFRFSPQAIEAARHSFDRLQPATALQRTPLRAGEFPGTGTAYSYAGKPGTAILADPYIQKRRML
jgi:hypothetical protein